MLELPSGESPDILDTNVEPESMTEVVAKPYRLPRLDEGLVSRPGCEEVNDATDEVCVTIEFGSSSLTLTEFERLGPASLLTLEQDEEDEVNLTAAGKVVARGQLLIVEGKLAVEITHLVGDVANDQRQESLAN